MYTKAAVLYQMEQPRPYIESQPLVIEELKLAGPGPGEVLVEVASAGLCHSDLSVIEGTRPRVMPLALGHEASGIVLETGPEVKDFSPGDHVVFSFVPACGKCPQCFSGRPVLCWNAARANAAGTLLNGSRRFKNERGQELNHHLGVSAFSRYTVVARESLVKIDPKVPLDKAALFGCAVLTGVGAVVNTARVAPGESVAVFGLGGIGLSAVMGARAAGAYPIVAVTGQAHKRELALRAGATHLVVTNGATSPVEEIKDLTGGGAAYAFESAGSEKVLAEAYQATGRGGTTVTVGLPHPSRQLSIPAVSLVAEEKTIRGSYMGSAVPARDIPRFIAMYQAGMLPVDLLQTHTITLDEINPAFDNLARGEAVRQLLSFAP